MGKRERSSTSARRIKKTKLKHVEFSKISVAMAFLLAFGFVIFVCYEMHIQQNLEPVSYIGAGVLLCLAIIVRAYMKRAYQKDLADIEIEKTRRLTEIKKEAGDDFVYERIEDVSLDS